MKNHNRYLSLFLTPLWIILITGCATLDGPENPDDPFERFNRSMYSFNETFDEYAYKPVAKAYKKIAPGTLDKAITNIFSNLDDIVVIINDALQFNVEQMASDISRFLINSTLGIAGIMDIATKFDIKKHKEDFGQTLAVWGLREGPYLVLPFLGPSNIRDSIGFVVDTSKFDVTAVKLDGRDEAITISVKYIDIRGDLLRASKLLQEIAPDPYAFTRDAWTQRRNNLVHNGEAPTESDPNELLFEDDLFTDDIIRK